MDINNNLTQSLIEDIESRKQSLVEQAIQKWLILQKTVKEEITLEEEILKQQADDFNNLKKYFKIFYTAKIKSRQTYEEIFKLNQNDFSNFVKLEIEEHEDKILKDACEPIKNLLFLFRNNYDYVTKLISLIDEQDEKEQIDSLVELFCNQFYDNILIPNPEQEELLLLIYKLLEAEITPMNTATIDEFLNDNTFLGKFIASFMKRQELNVFLTMLLVPIISSIENDGRENLDLSLFSIKEYVENKEKSDKENNKIILNNLPNEEDDFFKDIPKTKIKFKKILEIEAEKAKENSMNNSDKENEDNHINNNNSTYENDNNISSSEDEEINNEYKEQLTQKKLNKKMKEEKNIHIKEFYEYQLEQIGNDSDIFSNKGLLEVLEEQCFDVYKPLIMEKYKSNFLFIRKKIDILIQAIIDKITTVPYTVRCICKIISVLLDKKFPLLSKYLRNSFIGKLIFDKCIFPVLNLENKNVIGNIIFSPDTQKCLNVIISVLSKAYKCSLYTSSTDTEKTIFNYYLIEIIPILNKFYDKLIDIELPKVLDDLINKTKSKLEENIYNLRRKNTSINDGQKNNSTDGKQLYNYFRENSDEILSLQCICFSIYDILYIMTLINKNKQLFSNLPDYNFFDQTVKIIQHEEYKLDMILNENPNNKKFFVIYKDGKNSQLEKLLRQNKQTITSLTKANSDTDLICIRIKHCIKTILRGLNLLNNKVYSYLNMASSNEKILSALQYTLEDLSEFSEKDNEIPLKWYGQFITNNLSGLDISYRLNDFEKLYNEIFNEESNTLDELKNFSSIITTRDGQNLRCAEKIVEMAKNDLKKILQAKKFVKIEKFVDTKEIKVCFKTSKENSKDKIQLLNFFGGKKDKEKEKETKNEDMPYYIIQEQSLCPFLKKGFLETLERKNKKKKNYPCNANFIKDFINKFSDKPWGDVKMDGYQYPKYIVKDDINKGIPKNQMYKTFKMYMEIVKEKINKSKKLFGNITEKECEEVSNAIEDHILRQIYRYVFPPLESDKDKIFYMRTQILDWITPEMLEIKKEYINQLSLGELCIKKLDEAKSVRDKINCISSALSNMNDNVKFSSGKNNDAGQDELTPLFQYIIIRAHPKRIYTNLNYIKCFLDMSLGGTNAFLVTQLESAISFIMDLNYTVLKITKEDYDENVKMASKRYTKEKQKDIKNKNKMKEE